MNKNEIEEKYFIKEIIPQDFNEMAGWKVLSIRKYSKDCHSIDEYITNFKVNSDAWLTEFKFCIMLGKSGIITTLVSPECLDCYIGEPAELNKIVDEVLDCYYEQCSERADMYSRLMKIYEEGSSIYTNTKVGDINYIDPQYIDYSNKYIHDIKYTCNNDINYLP